MLPHMEPGGSSWVIVASGSRKGPRKQNRKPPALSVVGAWASLTCHQPAQPASAHCPHHPPPGCTCAGLLIPEPQAHTPWFGRDGLLAELAPTPALGCCPACQHPNPACPRPPRHLHLLYPPLGCLSCAHPDGSQLSLVPCLPSHSPPPAGERTPPRQGPASGLRPALWPSPSPCPRRAGPCPGPFVSWVLQALGQPVWTGVSATVIGPVASSSGSACT